MAKAPENGCSHFLLRVYHDETGGRWIEIPPSGCFLLAGYDEVSVSQSVSRFSSISEDDNGFTPNLRSSMNYI